MSDQDIQREERVTYVIAIAVFTPVVLVALFRHVAFDGGASLCLLLAVLGILGFVADWRRRPQLPRGRARICDRESEQTRNRS
jgi:hypothetical protein